VNLTRFFRPRWIWRLPLRRLLPSLRIITIHPCLITGYDIEMKLWSSVACCLSSVQKDMWWAFWSSLSSLVTNLTEMRLVFKLFARMHWMVLYDSPTISQTSWIVCLRSARIASRTFAMFFGVVLVDGRPERSSSSTDVCPSLKRLSFCISSAGWIFLKIYMLQFSPKCCRWCKVCCARSVIEGTWKTIYSSCRKSASIGRIFLKLHTSPSQFMQYKRCSVSYKCQ
jgi:hypothetical protein